MVLSPLRHPDKLVWIGTKNGLFLVRSAYHLEMTRRVQEFGECSKTKENHDFWKAIWNLQAPAVLKNFVWKICNNLLPTKENLFRKHIVHDPLCPFCLVNTETTCHILWSCPSSVAVWQERSRRVQKISLVESEGVCFIKQLMAKLEVEEVEEALTVARLIWLRRNSFVFGREFTFPSKLVIIAKESVDNFLQANHRLAPNDSVQVPILFTGGTSF